ncbi:hypothetical protein [Streptomyces sp. NPDC001492]
MRGLIEHAAHRFERLSDAYGPGSAHQLELIARRLYGIQQSLDSMADALPAAAQPSAKWPSPPAPTPGITPGAAGARLAR